MEASAQNRLGGGLWNNPRATQYSRETQDLLRLMMQESKLNNLQRKKINECLQNGATLPLTSDPTSSSALPQAKPCKSVKKCFSGKPQRRSAESCRSGDGYTREKFRPGPTRDLEKEKRRLQNILATGQEEPEAESSQNDSARLNSEEKDRFEEVLDEIEERREFLEHMASLGQEKPYINLINTEISQRIQELKVLEKAQSPEMDAVTSEKKEEIADQKPGT
ncbi:UPF0193 protein EVG1 [Notolabrus celidotus]|uniref:UPF0193 protein EVG1 n=1 Tax=Notolabrus celidotus TaxID=1203425 RepID=UPI00148FD62C|nr:UPF0193 protein EVG1 [Notolabrus celidotus]XP_034543113.1 UPF0193 protein EVG1 [Notolabrus celidotus]